jgi:hypothetical protein
VGENRHPLHGEQEIRKPYAGIKELITKNRMFCWRFKQNPAQKRHFVIFRFGSKIA